MMKHTPGPWEYVPSTEHHGPYVTSNFGSTICDCYVMSKPAEWSVGNGGDSKPVPFLGEMADPNARLIAAAPELLEALIDFVTAARNLRTADFSEYRQAFIEADERARAAIAKATGAK
jgi:hypothetical protein